MQNAVNRNAFDLENIGATDANLDPVTGILPQQRTWAVVTNQCEAYVL